MAELLPRFKGERGRHEIQRMLPRHHKIAELALAGHNSATIAETLSMKPRSVSIIMASPLFQSEISRRRETSESGEIARLDRDAAVGKARSILEEESVTAAQTVVGLMAQEDPNIQLRAAVNILDRVFPKETAKTNSGPVVNVELNGEQAQLLVLAMKESDNGQDHQLVANCTPTHPTEGEQGAVHETSETSSECG